MVCFRFEEKCESLVSGNSDPPPRGPQDMSEPEKPKRPWFRFHLLTAVLMMLIAGSFVAANVLFPYVYEIPSSWGVNEVGKRDFEEWYGSPAYFLCLYKGSRNNIPFSKPHWQVYGLVSDIAAAVAAIVTVGIIMEGLIRRRETRKA
jgi:hypothetical protein